MLRKYFISFTVKLHIICCSSLEIEYVLHTVSGAHTTYCYKNQIVRRYPSNDLSQHSIRPFHSVHSDYILTYYNKLPQEIYRWNFSLKLWNSSNFLIVHITTQHFDCFAAWKRRKEFPHSALAFIFSFLLFSFHFISAIFILWDLLDLDAAM